MTKDELILEAYKLMDSCVKGEQFIQDLHDKCLAQHKPTNVYTHPYGITLLERRFYELNTVFNNLIALGINPDNIVEQWYTESNLAKQWLGVK